MGACDVSHCCYNSDCSSNWCEGSNSFCKCESNMWGGRRNTGKCTSKRNNHQKAYNGDYSSCDHGDGVCGWCGPSQFNGRSCSENSDCESDWCDGHSCRGTCRSKAADGERAGDAWDYKNSCESGVGNCGYCGQTNRNGYPCNEDSDCTSDWCDGGTSGNCGLMCADKKDDGEMCPLRPWPSRAGIDNACKSGKCMGFLRSEGYCRPSGGFLEGMKCTEDSDCSVEGQGLRCNRGPGNGIGKCESKAEWSPATKLNRSYNLALEGTATQSSTHSSGEAMKWLTP